MQLLEHVMYMVLDGGFCNRKCARDFFVRPALLQQREDLLLSTGEDLTDGVLGEPTGLMRGPAKKLGSNPWGAQQFARGSSFDGFYEFRHGTVPGNEPIGPCCGVVEDARKVLA